MTRFVPCSSLEVAQAISGALWNLTRPPGARAPDEVSAFWCVWRVDAAGQWWIQVQTDEGIPVHAQAEIDGIAPILLNAGIAQADIDALAALIESMRGQRMTPWQFFPQVFKDASKLETEITWPERA